MGYSRPCLSYQRHVWLTDLAVEQPADSARRGDNCKIPLPTRRQLAASGTWVQVTASCILSASTLCCRETAHIAQQSGSHITTQAALDYQAVPCIESQKRTHF